MRLEDTGIVLVGLRSMICLGKYQTTDELMNLSELGIRLTKKGQSSEGQSLSK